MSMTHLFSILISFHIVHTVLL